MSDSVFLFVTATITAYNIKLRCFNHMFDYYYKNHIKINKWKSQFSIVHMLLYTQKKSWVSIQALSRPPFGFYQIKLGCLTTHGYKACKVLWLLIGKLSKEIAIWGRINNKGWISQSVAYRTELNNPEISCSTLDQSYRKRYFLLSSLLWSF